MAYLKDARISRKLFAVLALFFALGAVLTALAATNIITLAGRTQYLAGNEAEVLSETARAQENLTRMHQLAFQLGAPSGTNSAALERRFNTEQRELWGRLRAIEPKLSPSDRLTYQVIGHAVADYSATWNSAEASLARGDRTRFETLLEMTGVQYFSRADAAFDILIEAQNKRLNEAAQDARAQARSALVVIIGGGLSGLLAVSAMALWVVRRQITAPLAAVTNAMNRLARGDHTASVGVAPQGDEIGDLIRAFDSFRLGALERMAALVEADHQRAQAEAQHRRGDEEKVLRIAAEESNRLKSQFLANMSHELRTPLNAILGYAEMSVEELTEESSDHPVLPDLTRIITAGNHLLSLINDILDLAKIEAGAVEPHISRFDPTLAIVDVTTLAGPLAQKTSTNLIWLGAECLADIETDERRFKQCLLNLVSNACKFTKSGNVEIGAELIGPQNARLLQVSVADSGVGMTLEQLGRVFEPFEQADASVSRQFGGTGLGLSICRRLARMLGGDVWLESAKGVGTTAYLTVACDFPAFEHESTAPNQSRARRDRSEGFAHVDVTQAA